MVSKVAVIALVAVIAVPILLGYALNIQEVTENGYEIKEDGVNVTPLLQNSTGYTITNANIYQLNSNFGYASSVGIEPVYESLTNVYSSAPSNQISSLPGFYPTGIVSFDTWVEFYFYSDITYLSTDYVSVEIIDQYNTTVASYSKITSFYWNLDTSVVSILYYLSTPTPQVATFNVSDPANYRYQFSATAGYNADCYHSWTAANLSNSYIDLASGYHFKGNLDNWWIKFPSHSNNVLLTINLDSISDSNYSIKINSPATSGYVLEKTTSSGGVVSWKARNIGNPSQVFDLYYDSSRSDNTYQYYLELTKTGEDSYSSHREFRYVGGWPTIIGQANAYSTYSDDVSFTWPIDVSLDYIAFYESSNGRSPTIRADAATFRSMEYPIIENKTYNPSSFKTNPATTIGNITQYGTSISFGGNTYVVKDGKITIDSHSIPVKGLVMSSILIDGVYENRIGNTVISTTITPSNIDFNGQWSASITTATMEETTYTKTEWTPGQFGWNGIDQNFLMVGLLTSIGVFIALGIYIRRTKANLWPLLIVCGGAAMLFFCML